MNDADRSRDRRHGRRGATTAGKGTPAAVDVSTSRRGRTEIALLLAGPAIWSVHFVVVYLTVEAGCTGDGPGFDLLDPPVPTAVTLAATAVAASACLASAGWSHRRWRADRTSEQARAGSGTSGGDPSTGDGSLPFAGLLLSLFGFLAVLFVGVPALVLPACLP